MYIYIYFLYRVDISNLELFNDTIFDDKFDNVRKKKMWRKNFGELSNINKTTGVIGVTYAYIIREL